MKFLVCPQCRGQLTLAVIVDDGDEIVEGKLECEECSKIYPIEDNIPNFLPEEFKE